MGAARPGDARRAAVRRWSAGQDLPELPAGPGVAQLLGPDEQTLLTARPSGLRRWLGTQLGPPRPVPAGRRPPTDLRPVARAVRWLATAGSFEQRLVYERWLEPLVPLSRRRDLRPPAFLHIDPGERFPRLVVRGDVSGPGLFFGPLRDRAGADRAAKALLRRFPLRPCDLEFEPQPDLPLGQSCFFAQVRSCSAPCLERIGADDYRRLARQAAAWLAHPGDDRPDLPRDCCEVRGRGLVVERLKGRLQIFPVRDGAVLDELAAERRDDEGLEAALAALDWDAGAAHDDRAWLADWLLQPRRRAAWLGWEEDAASLAARVRVVT